MPDEYTVRFPALGRSLTTRQREAFKELERKLAPDGEYAVKAEYRVKERERRDAAIMKLIEGTGQ